MSTEVEKDLRRISLFIPRFFAGLSAVVAALPILDRVLDVLPPVIRHRDIATVLATILAFAIIGGDFLGRRRSPGEKLQRMLDEWYGRKTAGLSTGTWMLLFAVLLTVGYVAFADSIGTTATNSIEEAGAIVWYLAIYGCLTKGLWQMSLRAYATREVAFDTET